MGETCSEAILAYQPVGSRVSDDGLRSRPKASKTQKALPAQALQDREDKLPAAD